MSLPELHFAQTRFQIAKDRDGRHRWSLYNATGTLLRRHAAGFESECAARRDAERVRDELAGARIIGESGA